MASIVRIKRSEVSGNPSTLGQGELAYSALADNGSNGGDRLYIGMGTETAGNAVNHIVIGGKYFTDMVSAATNLNTASTIVKRDASGNFSAGTITAAISGNASTATKWATARDLSLTGDGTATLASVDGSAAVSGALTLATVNTDVGTFGAASSIPVITVNAKGLVTSVSTASVASNLNISGDTGTDAVALLTDTLSFVGGSGITSTVTNNTVTLDIDSTVTTLTGTQTLTNKTLTLPTIGGTGAQFRGSTSGTTTLVATAIAGINTVTLPTTGTLATLAGTETLTSKTISGANNTITNIGNSSLTNSTITIGSTAVSLGGTSTSLAGVTELTVDNLNVNGNTLSSLDANGNIIISPNGIGTVDVANHRITGVATPTNSTDAANKAYVDNAISGLDWKEAAHVMSNVNVALTGNTLTLDIDSHGALGSADNGYRILLTGQTTTADNGIYVYSDNGTTYTLTRAIDADTYQELIGCSIYILEGVTYGKTGWVQTNHYITSFTGQVWTQFSGAGAYVAGNGLTLTGTTFDVGAGEGINVTANAVGLASSIAGAGLTYTTGVIAVGGTTDRISVTADAIDIASTYVGQTSITTLGTITTGTWSGNAITAIKGGTGLTSYSTGDIIYASGTNTLAKLSIGTSGKILQVNGSGTPVWADIDGGTY